METQYWVIGGEYDSADFRKLIDGTSEVLGPFSYFRDATLAWRERSDATRFKALMRYIIVSNVNGAAMTEVRQAAA
jgi:Domain of unknown function (DUF4170)